MNEDYYREQRAELVKQFWFLKSKRLYMSAKARVRKIAELDLEFKGTPKEETYSRFNYDKIRSL